MDAIVECNADGELVGDLRLDEKAGRAVTRRHAG
jgi:hypothetical protein